MRWFGRLRLRALGLGRLLAFGDELMDLVVEYRQRHRALGKQGVVEGADVEVRTELALGFGAQGDDADFAELVAQRLARPGNVAVDFGGDLVLAQRGMVAQIGQRLVAAPALVCRPVSMTRRQARHIS